MADGSSSSMSTCPVCSSRMVHKLIAIRQVPVHCNLLWTDRQDAICAPRGDIDLEFCNSCGHTYNVAFDPDLMEYSQIYENTLHCSPRFQRYATSLATRLIERYDLHGKDIIEIGSGQGDFLRLLCELGGNRGLGFDPSYVPGPGELVSAGQVAFIRDFYSDRYACYQADLICSRHVLEHIQDPIGFLIQVRQAIGSRMETLVFFEVPNAMATLRDLAIWDIIYEHCSYFSAPSLACAFSRSGFRVVDLAEAFAGQYLTLEALPSQERPVCPEDGRETVGEIANYGSAFAARYREKVGDWRRKLQSLADAGHRAVVWGAGSKGVAFLNTVKTIGVINYVVDINPRKQGMYVAGTGQEIVPPVFLSEYQPDILIVMNPVYEREIRRIASRLGLEAELVCM